jgi:hypothetical protein
VASRYSDSKEYSYANFHARDGVSGGGVFNESGQIVGALSRGRKSMKEIGFLNLWFTADRMVYVDAGSNPAYPASARLRRWFGGGSPLLSGDPEPPVVLGLDFL